MKKVTSVSINVILLGVFMSGYGSAAFGSEVIKDSTSKIKFTLKTFPNFKKNFPSENEPVVFRIESKRKPEKIKSITFDYGDGQQESKDLSCKSDSDCEAINFEHVYSESGVYYPSVFYGYNAQGSVNTAFTKKYDLKSINVLPDKNESDLTFLSKLYEKELLPVIEFFKRNHFEGREYPKVAVGIYTDSNYENTVYNKDYLILAQETEAILKRNGIHIVEKSPHALTRLARESVKELDEGNKKSNNIYLNNREYSLQRNQNQDNDPFDLIIKMEGSDDTAELFGLINNMNSHKERDGKESKSKLFSSLSIAAGDNNKQDKDDNGGHIQDHGNDDADRKDHGSGGEGSEDYVSSDQNKEVIEKVNKKLVNKIRPLLITEFDTADYVFFVNPKDWFVRVESGDYYDAKHGVKTKKRIAKVDLNVRILDRKSEIMSIRRIEGQDTNFIIPSLVRKGKITKGFSYHQYFEDYSPISNQRKVKSKKVKKDYLSYAKKFGLIAATVLLIPIL